MPLISVIALWAFAASVTLGDARQQLRTNAITDTLVLPLADVQSSLAPEALLSAVAMGTHQASDQQALSKQRAKTDGAVSLLRSALASDKARKATSDEVRTELTGFVQRLSTGLAAIRAGVDSGSSQRAQTVLAFIDLGEAGERVQEDIGAASLVDVHVYREAIALYPTGGGVAMLLGEQAIVLGAFAAGERAFTQTEADAFAQVTYNRRLVLEKLVADRLTPRLGTGLKDILSSSGYLQLTAQENQIIATPPGGQLAVNPKAFQAAATDVSKQYAEVSRTVGLALGDRAAKAARPVLIRLGLAGGLGLIAVMLSLLLSVRFGRSLARELTGLQTAAQELADRRLPRIMERLRNDEDVDVDAEAPPLQIGETTEVARVGEAFTTVQRTAVEAAIGQANLRRGVRQVFLNLARRSQSLLHRQLTMLDAMERKTSDPDALDELFRLDHLTTRMRRHAEGLIILSGALPARAWSQPVRVVDVVRAAIAEVESYTRVRVYVLSEASLQGAVVADVTHLIAELVENAASFSPPHTQVQVRAESVGSGFVVEIEDAGLGMTLEQLADVNARLAEPPDFDLADTDRLGLFVVAQLAVRHNIKVTLRQSPYGGTTAIVLMPAELMATQEVLGGPEASRRGPAMPDDPDLELPEVVDGGPDAPALTGRHRRLAGFLQRTRALQGPSALTGPAVEPEHRGNGHQTGRGSNGNGNGWHRTDPTGTPAGPASGGPPAPGQPASPSGGLAGGWPTSGPPVERPASWDTAQRDPSSQWPGAGREGPIGGAAPEPGPSGRTDRWESALSGPAPAPGGRSEDPAPGRSDGFRPADWYDARTSGPPAADSGSATDQQGWDTSKFDLWATTESAATSAGTHAGLPRRVRRASLAPQLRDAPAADHEDTEPDTETLRSPEQARALLSSLQSGWQRGRTAPDPNTPRTEEPR